MQTPKSQPAKGNTVFLFFMLVTFFVSIAGALQTPTLSLFLSKALQASPFMVGLFLPSMLSPGSSSVFCWPDDRINKGIAVIY